MASSEVVSLSLSCSYNYLFMIQVFTIHIFHSKSNVPMTVLPLVNVQPVIPVIIAMNLCHIL